MPTLVALPRRIIGLTLGILIIIVGTIIALVYLPRATITVHVATTEHAVTQDITLSTKASAPDFVRFVLPVKAYEREVTDSLTIRRDASKTSNDFAQGIVRLHNDQEQEQALLPKTQLRHETTGIIFLTDQAVAIPPRGEITVAVTAQEVGQAGNVAPDRFSVAKLPANLQKMVYGESETPFTGGVVTDTPITSEELEKAREDLQAKLTAKAQGELTAAAGGAATRPELIKVTITPTPTAIEAGSRAPEFTLTARANIHGLFIDENDLLSLTLLALRAKPRADEEFLSYQPDSFALEVVQADFNRGEARVQSHLTGTFVRKAGPQLFDATNLAGRTESEINEYFAKFDIVDRVDVSFWPTWVRTVPSRSGALQITIKDAR